jgi:hypothetical protein
VQQLTNKCNIEVAGLLGPQLLHPKQHWFALLCPVFQGVTVGPTHMCDCLLQEQRVVDAIANYFNRQIPQLPHNDEDSFLAALQQADLT